MIRWLVGAIGLSIVASHAVAADPIEIGIGYLGQAGVKSKLSLIEQPAENDGIAGVRLAIEDNNTTGKFLNQRFSLQEVKLREGEDAAKAAVELAGRNGFIIADLPADARELSTHCVIADRFLERGRSTTGCANRLPRQRDPCRANPLDARRRARPIPGVETVGAGCWWSARTIGTSSTPRRCDARPRGSAQKSFRSGYSGYRRRPAPTAA
jgi:hypothetical protein